MVEYIKTSRIGYNLDDAIERTSRENAMIIKMEQGLRKEYIEWNPLTQNIYQPKTDPRYFKKKKIVMRAGEEVVAKDVPVDMLTAEVNPFIQIIYKIVQRGGITSHEDIIRAMLTEERVLPVSSPYSINIINGILQYMNKNEFYLLKHDDKLKIGFELPKPYHLVEYKKGYDPFEYHIMNLAEGRGMISRDEIYEYIVTYLGWLKTLTKVDIYIKSLIQKGYLRKIQKNYFQFVKPLESNK